MVLELRRRRDVDADSCEVPWCNDAITQATRLHCLVDRRLVEDGILGGGDAQQVGELYEGGDAELGDALERNLGARGLRPHTMPQPLSATP